MKLKKNPQGFVLVAMLAIVMIISVICLGMIQNTFHFQKMSKNINSAFVIRQESLAVLTRLLQNPEAIISDARGTPGHHAIASLLDMSSRWKTLIVNSTSSHPKQTFQYLSEKVADLPQPTSVPTACSVAIYQVFVKFKANPHALPVVWQENLEITEARSSLISTPQCHGCYVVFLRKVR